MIKTKYVAIDDIFQVKKTFIDIMILSGVMKPLVNPLKKKKTFFVSMADFLGACVRYDFLKSCMYTLIDVGKRQ